MAGGAEETLAALLREAEALKARLEEERQKLNDVTRTFCPARTAAQCPALHRGPSGQPQLLFLRLKPVFPAQWRHLALARHF
ncbi:unnamed protein product [Plutella xylostella]|uniref:(diamondback moth) hypothetical protein n=1 Tax=Plutella xylostella TaxID=51655 RepID=A0A8S4FLG3_PLUXY|nr:unnamed protein product [Plutella xylostella]